MRFFLLFLTFMPATVAAQGRYQPQGAAQRAYSDGERLREQGDALRAKGEAQEAKAKYTEALEAMLEARKVDPAYIDVYVKLGLLYYSLARHAEALPALEAGTRRAPDNVDLQFWYGQNLLAAGKADEAVPVLEKVAEKGGERFPEVFLVLGEHWYGKGEHAKARPALEQYLRLEPEATAVRAQLGNTYFKLGLFAEALAAFEAVRVRWPDRVEVQVNIGNAHFQLGQYEKAVVVLEGALKKAPDRESVLFNLAQSYFKLGKFAESVPHYQRFVAARPDSFNGRYFLGSALSELGRDDEALEELAKAMKLKPEIAQPAYKIGVIHLKNGRLDAAETTLAQAAKAEPNDVWVKSAQGTVARKRNQLDLAMKLHREAAAAAPKEARLHGNLAVSALAANQLDVAGSAIEQALSLAPDDAWIQQAAGSVLAAVAQSLVGKDATAAEALLTRAMGIRKDEPILQVNRALARLAKGDAEGAYSDAATAQKQLPGNPAARYAFGRARLLKGDAPGAVETLKAAMEAQPSPAVALVLASAMVAADQLDGATDLLDESLKSWPEDAGLQRHRALVRYARAAATLGGDAQGRRVANDLRFALEMEENLPPALAARVRYASAVAALRRGEGKEARTHLGRATALGREDKTGREDKESRFLKAGTPAGHLDLLIAFSDVLQRNPEQALERLGPCTGALEKRLCKYAWDRVAASAFASGDLARARKALENSKDLGADPVIEHNLLVLSWQQKKGREKIGAAWKKLADNVPEALFNLGVAAESRGEQKEAWEAFNRYGRTDGPRAAEAREVADVKNRIYRFAEGGE